MAGPQSSSAQSPEIFREISIEPYGTITLGEAFSQKDALGEKLAENVYLLPSGFGETTGIAVGIDEDGAVALLLFMYDSSQSVSEMLAEYRQMLGEPDVSSGGCVFWQDDRTRFEILETEELGQPTLMSMMIDRRGPLPPGGCALQTWANVLGQE